MAVDDYWDTGRSGVLTILIQLSSRVGECVEATGSGTAIGEERTESRGGREAREVGALWKGTWAR